MHFSICLVFRPGICASVPSGVYSLITSEPSVVFEPDLRVYQGCEMKLLPLNVQSLSTETPRFLSQALDLIL